MKNKTEETTFNDERKFDNMLANIFERIITDNLTFFLEYCIVTHNAEPIKAIIEIISENQFECKDNPKILL